MFKWLLNLFKVEHGDLSKHRLHTTKYEDLCKEERGLDNFDLGGEIGFDY